MRKSGPNRVLRLVISALLLLTSLAALSTIAPAASAAPTSSDYSLSFNGTSQYAGVADQQIIPASTSTMNIVVSTRGGNR